jgi:CRP/FNR family cyclic AMP-dependent transcriptional regulator
MTDSTLVTALCSLAFLGWWKMCLCEAEERSLTLMHGLPPEPAPPSSVLLRRLQHGDVDSVAPYITRHSAQALGSIERTLRSMWLFAELDPADISQLAQITRRQKFGAGTIITTQGDVDNADMYGVLNGILKVTTRGAHGQEILVNLMQVGDLFGEVAFLDRQHRSATVTSLNAGELLVIPRAGLDLLLNRSPKVAIAMLTAQSRLVRRLTERAEDNAFLDVRARLAKRLVALADYFGTPLGPREVALQVALSQRDLGDMVQAKPASVSRCMREWVKLGLIERSKGRLVILDRERLQDVAAGAA